MEYIVYITINQCNGKFYIGVHKTNPEVFDGYIGNGIYRLNLASKDYVFHRAVRKYGYKNFTRTTIARFPDTEQGYKDALLLEATLVNPTLLKSKNCYNEAIGGSGGLESDKKRVYQFALNGEFLRSFASSREAAEFINPENTYSTLKAIRNNCLGTTKSSFGYYWSYKKEFGYSSAHPVAQYTIEGKFLRTFNSISEAEAMLEINNIYQAITKKYRAGGFQWRYFDGNTEDIPKLVNTKTKNNTIPIIAINKNTLELESFASVNDCISKHPELSASLINRVLSNIIKSHKGYIFKYKDEDIV